MAEQGRKCPRTQDIQGAEEFAKLNLATRSKRLDARRIGCVHECCIAFTLYYSLCLSLGLEMPRRLIAVLDICDTRCAGFVPAYVASNTATSCTWHLHSRWTTRTSVRLYVQELQRIDAVTKLKIGSLQASHSVSDSAMLTPSRLQGLQQS
jgi:hypothetical protein